MDFKTVSFPNTQKTSQLFCETRAFTAGIPTVLIQPEQSLHCAGMSETSTTNLTKIVHRHKTGLQSSVLKYSIMNSNVCWWKPVYPQHIFPTLPYQPNSSSRKQSNLPVLPSQAAKGVPINVNWDNSSICIFELLLASCQSASNLYHFGIMSI